MFLTAVDLSWLTDDCSKDGFHVERALAATGGFTQITSVGADATTYRDAGLAAGMDYRYRVRAYDAGGVSGYSNVAAVTTPEARVVVQNTTDVVNGDTRSPISVTAAPGPDGISLREALTAVNNVPDRYEITFSPELVGRSIRLTTPLPYILRNGTRIVGIQAPDGTPGVTLDAGGFTVCCGYQTLTIAASEVTVTGLRFANVTVDNRAVRILVGPSFPKDPGPQEITDVQIVDNVFDNRPHTSTAYAITLGPDGEGSGTRVRRVTIGENTFLHFQGNGTTVHLQGHGIGGVIEDVDIRDNVFVDCQFSVELVNVQGSNNLIDRTRIVRNVFTGSRNASLTVVNEARPDVAPATGNVISGTLIVGNRFTAGLHWALQLNGGSSGAIANTISSTWFVNNIIERTQAGVLIIGGTSSALGNRVEEVRVINSTFYRSQTGGVVVVTDQSNSSGNTVAGFEVRNSIFWTPGAPLDWDADFGGEVTTSDVSFTVTNQTNYHGVNGNLGDDPLFVAPDDGNFHLQAASPVIDRGSWFCAPTSDFLCYPRTGLPDLGALEFGSTGSVCPATLPSIPRGCTGVAARSLSFGSRQGPRGPALRPVTAPAGSR